MVDAFVLRTMVPDKGERQLTLVNPGEDSFADSATRLVKGLRLDAVPFLDHAVEALGRSHTLEPTELQRHRRDGDQHRLIEGRQLDLRQRPGADQQSFGVDGITAFFGHGPEVANIRRAVQDVAPGAPPPTAAHEIDLEKHRVTTGKGSL